MTLFRLSYLRGGQQAGCTFGAQDLVSALEFYELWEKMNRGIKEIEMTSLGHSRYGRSVSAAGRTRAESQYFGNSH